MAKPIRKITVNIPSDTLEQAQRITGTGVTQTILEGLGELTKRDKRSALRKLRGKVDFQLNLAETRK